MSIFGALLFLIAAMGLPVSLIVLIFKKYRRIGKRGILVSIALLFASLTLIVLGDKSNEEARQLGFSNAADRRAAAEAGLIEAAPWKELQAQRAAEAARQKEIDEAKRAHEETERRHKEQAEAARRAEERAEAERQKAEAARAEEERCKTDLQCIGNKHHIKATFACRPYVENLAKNDFQWVDSWSESKFSRFRFKNLPKSIVTYVGDTIQFQNGFGNWIRHIYECDFDVKNEKVVDVRARSGRLPSQ